MKTWQPNPAALNLLAVAGGPFDTPVFRRTWLEVYTGQRDVSFGAQHVDGTRAAIALLADGPVAESMPLNYGGIVATRPLETREVRTFLHCARRAAAVRWIVAKSVPLTQTEEFHNNHLGSRVSGWTSVVFLHKAENLERRFAYKARRSIRHAQLAGGEANVTTDPEPFISLYEASSENHWYRYPAALIRALCRNRLSRVYNVQIENDVVASILALVCGRHWMAWLAAQNQTGRGANANYLALNALLADAQRAAAPAVNLGISAGMPGVAHFKRRFGAVEVPVFLDRIGSPARMLFRRLQSHGRRVFAALLRRR